MGETTTYRSAFSRMLAVVVLALCVVVVVTLVVSTGPVEALRFGAPVALVGLLAWLAFWQPYVEVSDGGIELRNVWRTVHVPWPALQEVDSRLGLRLVTAYGSYQAWAAPAPRRARGVTPAPTDAAVGVLGRWDALRRAGHLDDPRLERPRARTHLHVPAIAATTALGVGTLLGFLL